MMTEDKINTLFDRLKEAETLPSDEHFRTLNRIIHQNIIRLETKKKLEPVSFIQTVRHWVNHVQTSLSFPLVALSCLALLLLTFSIYLFYQIASEQNSSIPTKWSVPLTKSTEPSKSSESEIHSSFALVPKVLNQRFVLSSNPNSLYSTPFLFRTGSLEQEIVLTERDTVLIHPQSTVQIQSQFDTEQNEYQVDLILQEGSVTCHPNKVPENSRFTVHAAEFSFQVMGTIFTVETSAGQTLCTVLEGNVWVYPNYYEKPEILNTNQVQPYIVKKGTQFLGKSGTPFNEQTVRGVEQASKVRPAEPQSEGIPKPFGFTQSFLPDPYLSGNKDVEFVQRDSYLKPTPETHSFEHQDSYVQPESYSKEESANASSNTSPNASPNASSPFDSALNSARREQVAEDTYQYQLNVDSIVAAPVVADHVIVLHTKQNTLVALNKMQPGYCEWKYTEDEGIATGIYYSNKNIIYGTLKGTLKARSTLSGRTVWESFVTGMNDTSTLQIHGQSAIIYQNQGSLSSYSLLDGALKWTIPLSSVDGFVPYIDHDNNRVATITANGDIQIYDTETAMLLDFIHPEIPFDAHYTPYSSAFGVILGIAQNTNADPSNRTSATMLVCSDMDGVILWKTDVGKDILTPIIPHKNNVFLINSDGFFRSYRIVTGAVQFSQSISLMDSKEPLSIQIISGDQLIISGGNQPIGIYNLENGEKMNQIEPSSYVTGSFLHQNQEAYFITNTGTLYEITP